MRRRTPQLLLAVAAAVSVATAAAQAPSSRAGDSRAGTVTNPTGSAAIDGAAAHDTDPGAPVAGRAAPEAPQTDSAVRQQAQTRRAQALEQCRTVTGASRTDCVRRADEEFKGATSNDTHADPAPG